MSAPEVSVVVPLAGDADAALRCLVALAEVPDDPAHEVVVVDDASADLGPLLERLDGDATVVRRARRGGLLRAWASGVERARGELVVLLAGPAVVAPDVLRPLAAALADPSVVAATAGACDPVGSGAVALRRASGPLIGRSPGRGDAGDVPDALAVAAVVSRLAAHGAIAPCPSARADVPGPVAAASAGRRDAVARGLDRHPPGTPPELTVVVPTLDAAGDRVRRCVRAIQERTDVPYELVLVDNGAPPQGFTAPVNAGIRAARGRHVVVCNDDVEVLPGWWPPLRAALQAGHPVAFPWTVDGAMREDFAAWCFAVSRDGLERFGVLPGEFLDPGLVVWYQDTDLLERLRAAGEPPVLVREAHVRHGLSETVATDDPPLRSWIDAQVRRDHDGFLARHGAGVAGAAGRTDG